MLVGLGDFETNSTMFDYRLRWPIFCLVAITAECSVYFIMN